MNQPPSKACITCSKVITPSGPRGGRNAKNCSKECSKKYASVKAMAWQQANYQRYMSQRLIWEASKREQSNDL